MHAKKRKFAKFLISSDHSEDELDSWSDKMPVSSIVDPIDYENYIDTNKSTFNALDKYLLLFPQDDIKVLSVSKHSRLVNCGLPPRIFNSNPLSRHTASLLSATNTTCIQQHSSLYRGGFDQLPIPNDITNLSTSLSQYWFVVDQAESTDFVTRSQLTSTTHTKNSVEPDKTNPVSVEKPNRRPRLISSKQVDSIPVNKVSTPTYLECRLVVCNAEKYQAYLREHEGKLNKKIMVNGINASEQSLQSTVFNKCDTKPYCLRQLKSDDFGSCLQQSPKLADNQLTELNIGLYVIAPVGWAPSSGVENIIRLDELDSASPIGTYWLRLDSLFSNKQSTGNCDSISEHFIYFNPVDVINAQIMRDQWLQTIRMLIKSEQHRSRMGYHTHNNNNNNNNNSAASPCQTASASSGPNLCNNVTSHDLHAVGDTESVRGALQRISHENDLVAMRERHKKQVPIVTLIPSVRPTLMQWHSERDESKRPEKSSVSHVVSAASVATTVNAVATGLNSHLGSNSIISYPDRVTGLCKRRFLLTCIKFRTQLQSVVGSSDSPNQQTMDNPEPFYFTTYLMDIRSGRRVSEEFYWNPNTKTIESMLTADQFCNVPWKTNNNNTTTTSTPVVVNNKSVRVCNKMQLNSDQTTNTTFTTHTVKVKDTCNSTEKTNVFQLRPNTAISPHGLATNVLIESVQNCRNALFSIPDWSDNNQFYFIIQIHKILNGSLNHSLPKYLKSHSDKSVNCTGDNYSSSVGLVDQKSANNLYRSMQRFCHYGGKYRMPFAWGIRPLLSSNHNILLFKADPTKLSHGTFLHTIQSMSRVYDSCSRSLLSNIPTRTTDNENASRNNGSSDSLIHNLPNSVSYLRDDNNIHQAVMKEQFNRTLDEASLINNMERLLKTPSLPFILNLAVSELVLSQAVHPGNCTKDYNKLPTEVIITSDLVPINNDSIIIGKHPNNPSYFLPVSHPSINADEVIMEVEHFFDLPYPHHMINGSSIHLMLPSNSSEPKLSPTSSVQSIIQLNGSSIHSSCNSSSSDPSVFTDTSSKVSASSNHTNSLDRARRRIPNDSTSITGHIYHSGTGPIWNEIMLVPFTTFKHDLYVTPKSLNLAVKHNFPRARNISCFIELRANDSLDDSAALKVFRTRPSSRQPIYDSWTNTAVTHHDATPCFDEQVKICLPLQLTHQHHLLFRFYHVSCEAAAVPTVIHSSPPVSSKTSVNLSRSNSSAKDKGGKKKVESSTGYSWVPILGPDGNLNNGLLHLRVAAKIQPGYLELPTLQRPTSSIVSSGPTPDTHWLDNGKPLFVVDLNSLSSAYTHDSVLAKFFQCCDQILPQIALASLPKGLLADKSKTNHRVTFSEDKPLSVPSISNNFNFSTSSKAHGSMKRTSVSTNCTLLCESLQSLSSISIAALIEHLPMIINQCLYCIVVCAGTTERWRQTFVSLTDVTTDDTEGNEAKWEDALKMHNSASHSIPDDVLKTALSVLSRLISYLILNYPNELFPYLSAMPLDPKQSNRILETYLFGNCNRQRLVEIYVQSAFDPESIINSCVAYYLPSTDNDANLNSTNTPMHKSTEYLPTTIHEALIRGLALLLMDPFYAQEHTAHVCRALWFIFTLVAKSMTEHVCSINKIRADRSVDSRFPSNFSNNLTLLIRALGTAISSSVTQSTGHFANAGASAVTLPNISNLRSNGSSQSLPLRISLDIPQHQEINGPTTLMPPGFKYNDIIALIGRFLGCLLNLMNRGYVLNRIRDILAYLEVTSKMHLNTIDCLNELRLQFLRPLCEHEHFVQLNLPTPTYLDSSQNPAPELSFDDEFCRHHFIIGILLSQLDCLLARCMNSGSCALRQQLNQSAIHSTIATTPVVKCKFNKELIRLLMNLLIKHCLDRRLQQYTTITVNNQSSNTGTVGGSSNSICGAIRSSVFSLYLYVVKLMLQHLDAFGPPGGDLQTDMATVKAVPGINSNQLYLVRSKNKRPNKCDKSKRRSSLSENSVSTGSGQSDLALHYTDNSIASDPSFTDCKATNRRPDFHKNENTAFKTTTFASQISSVSDTSSCGSSASQSACFLTDDGKVKPNVLDRIAGVNPHGSLDNFRHRPPIRPASLVSYTSSCLSLENNSTNSILLSSAESTTTLTDLALQPNSLQTQVMADMHNKYTIRNGSSLDTNDHDYLDEFLSLAGLDNDCIPATRNSQSPHASPVKTQQRQRTVLPDRESKISLDTQYLNADSDSKLTHPMHPLRYRHVHHRPPTKAQSNGMRQLEDKLQREFYLCLLIIASNVDDKQLKTLFGSFSVSERLKFLTLIQYMVQHLRYRGIKRIQQYEHISSSAIGRYDVSRSSTGTKRKLDYLKNVSSLRGADSSQFNQDSVLWEGNLATQSCLIVLNMLSIFISVIKTELLNGKPSDSIFESILKTYICIMSNNPSHLVARHTISALRLFVKSSAKVLFSESNDLLMTLFLAGLQYAKMYQLPITAKQSSDTISEVNSTVSLMNTLSLDSCTLLYCLWKSSFESHGQAGFSRAYMQNVIAISNFMDELTPEFEICLSVLQSLAQTDMLRSSQTKGGWTKESINQFLGQISQLINLTRTVLNAIAEMCCHSDDPERLIELHYALASSFKSNATLRRAWLDKLATLHMDHKNYAEYVMAFIHRIALMAECLKRRDQYPMGCEAFSVISSNISIEEGGLLEDSSLLETPYDENSLLNDLYKAASISESNGLYEIARSIYHLIIPIHEKRMNYANLSNIYQRMASMYGELKCIQMDGHRLSPSFYRVAYHGKLFGAMAGKTFIYRTEPCVKLGDESEKLLQIYSKKYKTDEIKLLTETFIDPSQLDNNKAYIQITYVEPHKESPPSSTWIPAPAFQKYNNVSQFSFYTPFLKKEGLSVEECLLAPGPKRSDDLTQQCKRCTILTTEAAFPGLRKRLAVINVQYKDLDPIDSAIGDMQNKNQDLMTHLLVMSNTSQQTEPPQSQTTTPTNLAKSRRNRVKRPATTPKQRLPLLLEMALQGALLPTVNAGPMSYAHAFLKLDTRLLYPPGKVEQLKRLFFDFLSLCMEALTHYQRLMQSAQLVNYRAMANALDTYRVNLSNLLEEEIIVDVQKMRVGPKSELSKTEFKHRLFY